MRQVERAVEDAECLVLLGHLVLSTGEIVRKGCRLETAILDRPKAPGITRLAGVLLDRGDVHEDDASARIARASIGSGIRLSESRDSKVDYVAEWDGLLRVDTTALLALNRIADIAVFTRFDCSAVRAGQVVGGAKALPLVVADSSVVAAERSGSARGPALRVDRFRATTSVVLVRDRVNHRT